MLSQPHLAPTRPGEYEGCLQHTRIHSSFPAALQRGLRSEHFFIASRSRLNLANAHQGSDPPCPPGLPPAAHIACPQVQLQVVLCRHWGRASSASERILSFSGLRLGSSVILFILKYPLHGDTALHERFLCARSSTELFTHISLFHPRRALVLLLLLSSSSFSFYR